MFRLARLRARDRGLPFSLTPADIVIPNFCPVLGIPISPGVSHSHDASPTLDRINPDLGYVPDNVVVVSMRANRLKSNATAGEMGLISSFYRQFN